MNCGRFDCKIKGKCTTECRLYEKLEGNFTKCRHWKGTCFGPNCMEFDECRSSEWTRDKEGELNERN